MSNPSQSGTTTLQLAAAWAFVGVPLLWGVINTLAAAAKLFS
jgi:hypothetical protein